MIFLCWFLILQASAQIRYPSFFPNFVALTNTWSFFFFLQSHLQHMLSSRARGSKQSWSCRPSHCHSHTRSQPHLQPNSTACSNTRSLNHWTRPRVELQSSRILCRVLNLLSHNGIIPFYFPNVLSILPVKIYTRRKQGPYLVCSLL